MDAGASFSDDDSTTTNAIKRYRLNEIGRRKLSAWLRFYGKPEVRFETIVERALEAMQRSYPTVRLLRHEMDSQCHRTHGVEFALEFAWFDPEDCSSHAGAHAATASFPQDAQADFVREDGFWKAKVDGKVILTRKTEKACRGQFSRLVGNTKRNATDAASEPAHAPRTPAGSRVI